jgi:O-antigen ligase
VPLAERDGFQIQYGLWVDAFRILGDFPVAGIGLGGFREVIPLYKSRDISPANAGSGLIGWWTETGWLGLILLSIAAASVVRTLPRAWHRLGAADRGMAGGFVGAMLAVGLLALIHPVVPSAAVGFALATVAGTGLRWLSGGTDLWLDQDAEGRLA